MSIWVKTMNIETEEIQPKDLEEQEFWGSDTTSTNENDFIKLKMVKDKEVEAVKITEYLGLKMTAFKEEPNKPAKNYKRPNFMCIVIDGTMKGKKIQINLSRARANFLCDKIGTRDFKKWVDVILTTTAKQMGMYEGIDYAVYKKLGE